MTVTTGLDYAWGHPSPAQIKGAGHQFVCRYLSWDASKNLTSAEASALRSAGLGVVSNWEYYADDAKGRDRHGNLVDPHTVGAASAREALRLHRACGGPSSAPIYFSVDWDTTEEDRSGCITDYLAGVASVIPVSRIGVYGGYYTVRYALDHRQASWGWQSYAWSGDQWDSRAVIRQVRNGIRVAGHDCDLNEAHADNFGQWDATGSTDTMGDDDVTTRTSLALTREQPLSWGAYRSINWNAEATDPDDAHTDGSYPGFVSPRSAYIDVDVLIRVRGMLPGDEYQVRLANNTWRDGKPVGATYEVLADCTATNGEQYIRVQGSLYATAGHHVYVQVAPYRVASPDDAAAPVAVSAILRVRQDGRG